MNDNEIDSLLNYFKVESQRLFQFLKDYGFQFEGSEVSSSKLTTKVKYFGKNIAVVLQYDLRTEFSSCCLFKVSQGKIDWNEGQYQLFSYLLKKCGYRGKMLNDTSMIEDNKEKIRLDLDRYATVLKSHGENILADMDIFS